MKFDFETGLSIIKNSLVDSSKGPGIYQFFDGRKKILYIGKAKNIASRVKSYLNFKLQSNRIKKMIGLVRFVEFIKTHTEVDALLLESNLIKKNKPFFNIRLQDDKSFPFILLNKKTSWPRLQKIRGENYNAGFVYGPFSSGQFVDKIITILEKGFLLRTCNDQVFNNRKNPCILYQIKRCSAPCVGYIKKIEYIQLVDQAIAFLNGKDKTIKKKLISLMEYASYNQHYEEAALYRDRIKALSKISQEKYSFLDMNDNFDIVCAIKRVDIICVQVFFFRTGKNLGNKEFFFEKQKEKKEEKLIEEFLSIFYINKIPPKLIILNKEIENKNLLELALKKKKNINSRIMIPKKGKKRDIIKMVEKNIIHSIDKWVHKTSSSKELEEEIFNKFKLKNLPKKIEVYDNSHLSGSQPVGAMIVYKNKKFSRENYRKFNIRAEGEKTNDDYFMMGQVLDRRLNIDINKVSWKDELPNLILIDGGKGHLNVVQKILNKKKINNIDLISIAKGKNRNAGEETIFIKEETFKLEKNNEILFFFQRLRDEAHRFAISSQRYRRNKLIKGSVFDTIIGIGAKTKKKLLTHFGSVENIKTAGLRDLEKTPGIGKEIAKRIYKEFNE